MKKVIASVLSVAMVAAFATACQGGETQPTGSATGDTQATQGSDGSETEATTTAKQVKTYGTGSEKINLWSFTAEIPNMVNYYVKNNPDFASKYTVECTIIATNGGAYQTALDQALSAGGDSAPDMYAAEAAFIIKYSQGDMAKYAASYKELGIDVDGKIKDAQIAGYTIEAGSRDGEVVALGYQATGSAMIYRADLAKDVFGTDDPAKIEEIFGANSGSWDKFWAAAAKLKEKNISVVSGSGDMWNVNEKAAKTGWIVNNQLNIDPKRAEFLDIAKKLKDDGLSNDAAGWSEAWFADMAGTGAKPVFCFFGPAWLINYTMNEHCGGAKLGEGTFGQWRVCTPPVGFFWGGTWVLGRKDSSKKEGVAKLIEWITLDTSETGLQYLWANGLVDWDEDPATAVAKDTVASAAVMSKSDGKVDFCGGQDIFPTFIKGNQYASAKAMTQYDEGINGYFTDAATQYAEGNLDKDAAIDAFKTKVNDNLSF